MLEVVPFSRNLLLDFFTFGFTKFSSCGLIFVFLTLYSDSVGRDEKFERSLLTREMRNSNIVYVSWIDPTARFDWQNCFSERSFCFLQLPLVPGNYGCLNFLLEWFNFQVILFGDFCFLKSVYLMIFVGFVSLFHAMVLEESEGKYKIVP